jgi:hypothetical protein
LAGTYPTYSYVGYYPTTHNPKLWVVLATITGPSAGARTTISSPALGIMIKINMPEVRKTIQQADITPYLVGCCVLPIGGPAQKMLFFQMVPKSFLSVLIHSTRCKYDSLDFFFKHFDWNLPVGRVKVKIVEFCLE